MPKDLTCQFQRWNLLLYIGGFKHLGAFCELWIHLRIWLAVCTWHRFLLKLNLANYSTTRRQLESLRVFPKIVQLCPKWYLNKCFYQSALSCNEKNANKPSLKSFVYLYKRGNLVTFAHTHTHTWTLLRHQRSLLPSVFLNFQIFAAGISFSIVLFFVPIIFQEPVWFFNADIWFYCQLAGGVTDDGLWGIFKTPLELDNKTMKFLLPSDIKDEWRMIP